MGDINGMTFKDYGFSSKHDEVKKHGKRNSCAFSTQPYGIPPYWGCPYGHL